MMETVRHCLVGGLIYGWVWSSVICWLHIRYNSVHPLPSILLLNTYFFLIYALPITALCVLVGLFTGLTGGLRAGKDGPARAGATALGITAALTSFTFFFFLFFHFKQQAGHRYGPPGVLIMAGPHIRRGGTATDASVLDITPIVLALLGVPVGRDMDGRVLEDALTADFLASYPPEFVASHEDGSVARKVIKARPGEDELLE